MRLNWIVEILFQARRSTELAGGWGPVTMGAIAPPRLSPGFLPAFPRLSPGCTMECRGVSKSEVRHGSKDSYGEAININ